jgi:ribosomal-protein-alanine N-acetyltransferase
VRPENSTGSIILETPRLILRPFGANDVEAVFRFLGDPRVMRFSVRGPLSCEDIRARYLPGCLKRYSQDGFGQWAVIDKRDGRCIGECGICTQTVEGVPEHEVSYRLCPEAWGQGFATEAARACRDYGFKELALTRLIAIIEPENVASLRVAQKIGMTEEKCALFHGKSVRIYSVTSSV